MKPSNKRRGGAKAPRFDAREAALKALGAFRRKGAWPDLALSSLIADSVAAPLDIALATQIVNGVLQNMALCDHYAAGFSSSALNKLEPQVLDILRLSIFQIVFLTKIPHSAAVNEGVALSKKHSNPRAAGYVNAVLRKVADAAASGSLPNVSGGVDHRLSIEYSHPVWLVREFCGLLGNDGAEALLSANNSLENHVTAQVNTLRCDTGTVLKLLENDGVDASRNSLLDDCVEMRGAGSINRLDVFKKGYIYIQDVAAKLAVMAANPKKGGFVVDGCAAPGGKSFTAAISMGNSGRIAAFDNKKSKLQHIETGAKRMGIDIIEAINKDASVPDDEFQGTADVVIADVPCSGFGVIRKKPEIRYKSEADITGLPEVQRRILASLSGYVKPGGTLLYSTCTVLRRENEDVIEWFLKMDGRFAMEGFSIPGVGQVSGAVTLWPHIHGTDGFFICKLKRLE